MTSIHELNDHLTREADQFYARGGTDLDIGQVLDRVGEIRRGRRMRATMLMAACVLAIAVPTALVATRDDKTVTPAHQGKVDSSPLSLQALDRGARPSTGYLVDNTWHTPGNDSVDLSGLGGQINEVAPLAHGYLVSVATGGDVIAHYVDPTGKAAAQEWLISGSLAVSDDQHVGAFVEPDGTAVAVRDDGTARDFKRVPRGAAFDTIAVTGDCGSTPDDKNPCAIWVQSNGRRPVTWFVTSNAASTARTEYVKVADVRDDGSHAAGIVDVRNDLTTCSAVESPGLDAPGWRMCGFQAVAFAPDGRHLLAQPDGDGLGPTGLAVYDADNGDQLLDLTVADHGYVRQMAWEDDSHVLATVYQQGQWAIVRIGLDGSRQYAVRPVAATDDATPPFLLPSS